MKKKSYTYILTNTTASIFYVGATEELKKQISAHRNGNGPELITDHNCKYLVYYEEYETITKANRRKEELQDWEKSWKIELIRTINPPLRDLWSEL